MKTNYYKSISIAVITIMGLNNFAIAQWKAVTSPSGNYSVNCIGSLGTYLFAGISNSQGIMLSTNNAISWTPVNSGLIVNPTVYSFAFIGSTIFAVVGGAGNNGFGSIYISNDYGNSWNKTLSTAATMSYCTEIASSGNDLYAAISGGAGIYKSSDHGTTWLQVGQGIAKGGPLLVSGSNIYAGLSLSNDNGATWKALQNPGVSVSSSAVLGSVFYIGDNSGKGVFHTSDNGTSWNRDTTGLKAQSIVHMITSGPYLYVGTNGGGVYKSSNQGLSWTADNNGISQLNSTSFCFGKTSSDIFWASNGGSVYKKIMLSTVDEINLSERLFVYPNPSIGKFHIAFDSNNQNCYLEIFNITGERILYQQNLIDIDLTGSPKGIYVAKINLGRNVCIKKLIVQ